MNTILSAIVRHAHQRPEAIAIEGDSISLSYSALLAEVDKLAQQFSDSGYRCLGLMLDNGPAWAVADLAATVAGITLIPIPAFFTPEQALHALNDAQADGVITDHSASALLPPSQLRPLPRIAGQSVWLARLEHATDHAVDLNDSAKITYTSGTTAAPKGVCLSLAAMEEVAGSLCCAIDVTAQDRHLCLLPLAVLLENIGGIYTPLLGGATCVIPSLQQVGLLGAAGLDPHKMIEAINTNRASSVILLPQMLQALVAMVAAGVPCPESLRFIAVGGAPVSSRLLEQAAQLKLPVFEGYGLSECASVVAVNTPDLNRPGSVGQVLPHIEIDFAEDGEILLRGRLFNGYLNNDQSHDNDWYASGDLGYLDDHGYLYLTGRKKNCFITSFGRNVAPEWVERELIQAPVIVQAVVFGEARPFNTAIITAAANADSATIEAAINDANQLLPDYAQVSAWISSDEPFSIANKLFTATGRPRREAIWDHYGERLNALYESSLNSQLG